jgi:hypothetical protein
MLADYVRSPSLRHIRDPFALNKMARSIVEALDRGDRVWRKWDPARENLVRATTRLWLPLDDLVAFLNQMPGSALTSTDVAQRLRAFQEEPPYEFPDEDVKDTCLALYDRERSLGTELPAIVGVLQEFVADEARRLQEQRQAAYRDQVRQAADALQQRFLAGFDCKWTPVEDLTGLFCRVNGRTYRLDRGVDRLWQLSRSEPREDAKRVILGRYRNRADATRVVANAAYQPEAHFL